MPLETIRDLFDNFAGKPFTHDVLLIKEEDHYQSLTQPQLVNSVHHLGLTLMEMGINKGDKIGIMAENRLEWPITYLAVTCIGAVICPISILWESSELESLSITTMPETTSPLPSRVTVP